jgi:hypothetical protein
MDVNCSTSSVVEYGTDNDDLSMVVKGFCYPFNVGSDQLQQSNHVAYMVNLDASTKYFYRVGASDEWSDLFHFTTAPDADTIRNILPQTFLIYGDLGSSLSLPENSSTIMPWASVEVQLNHFDMVLHVGDFAYDFDSNYGETGRVFMNEISNMSAYVPYMVDPGNHEQAYNFAYYTEMFRNQPYNLEDPVVKTDNGLAPNNWYFSWNVGLVHFVTLSSEIYFHDVKLVKKQWEWFKYDLEQANLNRSAAPWIVVNAHRGLYCSCDGDCNGAATRLRVGIPNQDSGFEYGLEELLYDYGVDLWINGHEHNYERMYDISPKETFTYLSGYSTQTTVDPPATIYIVTGDAGNRENHEEFKYPQPDRTAFRTSAYGYRYKM